MISIGYAHFKVRKVILKELYLLKLCEGLEISLCSLLKE